jgi:cell filamentation protein
VNVSRVELDRIGSALAIVHARNGRCARLLSTLMGLQAGLPPLDFGGVRGTKKRDYIAAVHAALARDYSPMTAVFRAVIRRTLRSVARAS